MSLIINKYKIKHSILLNTTYYNYNNITELNKQLNLTKLDKEIK